MLNYLKFSMAVALAAVSASAIAAVTIFDVNGTLNNQATFTGIISIDTGIGVVNPATGKTSRALRDSIGLMASTAPPSRAPRRSTVSTILISKQRAADISNF